MNACTWQPTKVMLHDGRWVASNSQEWLLECEARHILKQPTTEARRALLASIEQRRGKQAREHLEERAMAIWRAQRK